MAGSRHLNAFKCSLQNRNPLALGSAVGDDFLPGLGFSIPVQSSPAVGICTIWTVFSVWQAVQSHPVEKEMQLLESVFLL